MILCGQQPNYLPWIGLFHKIALADRFVIVDHVQYVRRTVVNRNEILGLNGESVRLTVPVERAPRDTAIADVAIDDRIPWRRKHWRALEYNYRGAPHWRAHAPFFEDLYAREHGRLASLNVEIIRYLLDAFGLPAPVGCSGEARVEGTRTELLVGLCRAYGCDTYLSGAGARKYVDESVFRDAGLTHRFQAFEHPVYPQQAPGFVPNLSAVDLLFNVGPAAGDLIRATGGLA